GDHPGHGVLLVECGQHHRHRAPGLGGDELVDRPVGRVPGGHAVFVHRAGRPARRGHANPRTVRCGAARPAIAAAVSTTRRVGPTWWARKTRAPAAAATAVAASVPSRRWSTGAPRVSPRQSLLLRAI